MSQKNLQDERSQQQLPTGLACGNISFGPSNPAWVSSQLGVLDHFVPIDLKQVKSELADLKREVSELNLKVAELRDLLTKVVLRK